MSTSLHGFFGGAHETLWLHHNEYNYTSDRVYKVKKAHVRLYTSKLFTVGKMRVGELLLLLLSVSLVHSQGEGRCECSEKIDEIYKKIENLLKPISENLTKLQQPGSFPSQPASSCKEILEYNSNSPSADYWLRASNGTAVKVFCDMTRTCGGVTGGWMKVADLDMTKSWNRCPGLLRYRNKNGKRLCARESHDEGCSSVNYLTHGIHYNEVCGRIIGYQQGSTDGAARGGSISTPFIDGVTLSYGHRQHIWSFISALHEGNERTDYTCYCANRNYRGPSPPSFVGQDYFCDTGNELYTGDKSRVYDDPLWDGSGCGPQNECCTFNNPPWFHKSLSSITSSNIEMRVCRDEPGDNEDILLEKVNIYVR